MVPNVAEGRGRDAKDGGHHWRIARRSAEEVGAILEVTRAFGDLGPSDADAARSTRTRVQQMLWRMTRR